MRPMKKHGCCNDKVIEAKIQSDQNTTHGLNVPSLCTYPPIAFIYSSLHLETYFDGQISILSYSNAPPDIGDDLPIFIQNRNFRI